MIPMIDERLRLLLHCAAIRCDDGGEFSRDEWPKWRDIPIPPPQWTKPLGKAYAQANSWFDAKNREARYIGRLVEIVARLHDEFAELPFFESGSYHQDLARNHTFIGEKVSKALLDGDVDMFKSLWDLSKRWNGETRKVHAKPLELAVILEAFTLWQTHKRNPTRAEVWAACEAAGINVGDATNKRGLLQKTGLQFLAKG